MPPKGENKDLAPVFDLEVEGQAVGGAILQFVNSCEYESADGLADLVRLQCINPDAMLSKAKVFQPGNEISVYGGYGSALEHLGRAIIIKQVPNFPDNTVPTLEVVGYSKDYQMMDNTAFKLGAIEDALYSDVVSTIAGEGYDMELDVDETPVEPQPIIQKADMSDYDFILGMANINGFLFWVDGDQNGKWTCHFKNPKTYKAQDKKYTFAQNLGNQSTLMKFRPELAIKGSTTKIAVVVKDVKTGKVFESEVEEESNASPDVLATGDLAGDVQGEHTTASDIKLFINEFSFNVVSNRKFKTEAEVILWAQQWFRRMRENFLHSQGTIIGVENLFARQTHGIECMDPAYSGDYYFSKVKHLFNNDGYHCQFSARKVVPE